MPIEDVLICLDKLDETARYLPEETFFTLDHEPMSHPQIDTIIRAAANTANIKNYHHGMTSGLPIMRRKDKESIVKSYIDSGYRDFGITIHGSPAHHDEIVRRSGAFDTAVSAVRFLKKMGCEVQISLMLNRFFSDDAGSIDRLLEELEPNDVWFANPNFTPHANMRDFEPYRADTSTIDAIESHLPRWRRDAGKILENARKNSISASVERLREIDLFTLWEAGQDEKYLSLHQDSLLYYGNSGAETECLGDLRFADPEELAKRIASLPGNRDYGAFYDIGDLPKKKDVLKAIGSLPRDLVFGDIESIIYRAFYELGVPTKILSADRLGDR